jgi:hypothetical protein
MLSVENDAASKKGDSGTILGRETVAKAEEISAPE